MRVSTLRDARPQLLLDAAHAWDRLAGRFAGHAKDCGTHLQRRVAEAWNQGLGAESAADRLGRTQSDLLAAGQELQAVATALTAAAEILLAHQGRLERLLGEAHEAGFTVHDDGSVSAPEIHTDVMSPSTLGQLERVRAQNVGDLAQGIAAVLKDADAADTACVDTLRLLTEAAERCRRGGWGAGVLELSSARELRDDVLADIGMPDAHAAPKDVTTWGQGLPAGLRQDLLRDYPAVLGNRDGIPAADRDTANRAYLPVLLSKLKTDLSSADGSTAESLRAKIDGLQGLQQTLSHPGSPRPYLLGLSDEGNGRAIVSFGNPDTAENVSAYVPGLNTRLDGHFASADVERARNIARMAQKYGSTASITWLGYDAPQLQGAGLDDLAVMSDGDAQRGAVAYDRLLQGIRATHDSGAPHITALGHSYGSLTVGQASQQPGGLPADDVILVGSPGVGVDRASDLGLPAGHVYAAAAANDPVTELPSPDPLEYVVPGHGLGEHKLWFGTDPASRAFGARDFSVAPGQDTGLTGLLHGNLPAHTVYFDPSPDADNNGGSLRNIAKIVTGHGDAIKPAEPR
ncbi:MULTISPECIES: alpha/beta hydrolase [Streptomycetaceae]|nr:MULTISPECIES: alpha/beta hydrolase [Streptomycetaceae]MYS61196.1 hypothetical protein [Streptomyces sp. SID5468]CCB77045.1 conserved protein of unknown function [Streptantibioticus cattleyicolor NRRL 8057 = DSM 46488]